MTDRVQLLWFVQKRPGEEDTELLIGVRKPMLPSNVSRDSQDLSISRKDSCLNGMNLARTIGQKALLGFDAFPHPTLKY